MSSTYSDLGAVYPVFAGTDKNFTSIFIDPLTSQPQDLSDVDIYDSVKAIISKASGEIIGIVVGDFTSRPNGSVNWTTTTDINNNNNAGNHIVEVQLFNIEGNKIDSQVANYNILESH